ncbi:MAG: response regulator [bacterium]|nr:response regulator [bacterium]
MDERQSQERLAKRLTAMGLEVEILAGGRCLRGVLSLAHEPFLTPSGPLTVSSIEFASVGPQRIKCLRPASFFQLPIISIAGCGEASELEGRIRAAWIDHMAGQRNLRSQLVESQLAHESEWDEAGLALSVGQDDPGARARWIEGRTFALPSPGPLAGHALARASDRVIDLPAEARSASEIEIAITSCLDELTRQLDQREARRRRRSALEGDESPAEPLHPVFRGRDRQILLVGPQLAEDAALDAALRQRGFRTTQARGADSARRAFDESSFEVVVTDAVLDRAEGLELIPTLADVPGIGQLPVVLIDDRAREGRREAARALGAAGYLVRPLDPQRLAAGLERMLVERPRRRFDRFARKLAVAWTDGCDGFTTVVGRLGMFVSTGRQSSPGALESVELALPETGERVSMDVETLYRVDPRGGRDPGIGVRIRAFSDDHESLWIDYLTALEGATG